MNKCQKCQGDGLVGQGDSPWKKEGKVTTCPDCSGTGRLPESEMGE